MNSSDAYKLRSADIPFDRRVREFIELVNILQVGEESFSKDESYWKEGGHLEEEKVEITSSYEYWSINSEEDVKNWIKYELNTFITQNIDPIREFIETSTSLDYDRKQGLLFIITNTSLFISNLTSN